MKTLSDIFAEEEKKLDDARAVEKAAEQAAWDAMSDDEKAEWQKAADARWHAIATAERAEPEADDFDTDDGDDDEDF